MSQVNRGFTGYGFHINGVRQGYSWAAIGTGPTDPQPLVLQHGSLKINESTDISTIETTAFNGYTDCYAGGTTITGTIDGYIAASDGQHQSDPVSIKSGTRAYLDIQAGTLGLNGYCLIGEFDFTIDQNDFARVTIGFQFKGVPVTRRYGFLAGVGCNRP